MIPAALRLVFFFLPSHCGWLKSTQSRPLVSNLLVQLKLWKENESKQCTVTPSHCQLPEQFALFIHADRYYMLLLCLEISNHLCEPGFDNKLNKIDETLVSKHGDAIFKHVLACPNTGQTGKNSESAKSSGWYLPVISLRCILNSQIPPVTIAFCISPTLQ